MSSPSSYYFCFLSLLPFPHPLLFAPPIFNGCQFKEAKIDECHRVNESQQESTKVNKSQPESTRVHELEVIVMWSSRDRLKGIQEEEANENGQQRSAKVNKGPRRSSEVNKGQQRSTRATKGNKGQQSYKYLWEKVKSGGNTKSTKRQSQEEWGWTRYSLVNESQQGADN